MKTTDINITHFICPRCQQHAVRMPYTGDYIHECFNSEVLANEDVPVIGNWEDYTGSDVNVNNPLMQGTENKLQGTRAGLEGAKDFTRTSRGANVNTHRTRKHLEFIPVDTFANQGIPDNGPEDMTKY